MAAKWWQLVLCAWALTSLPARVKADFLFAATAAGTGGELYILDRATGGVIRDVGPLNDAGGINYPITGLAFHPGSGILYGSTGNSDVGTAAQLVRIDPGSARVMPVGPFNAGNAGKPATMADLAFDSSGTMLFGVGSVGGPQLYRIDVATGQATVIGSTGLTSTSGGGLSVSASGTLYGTPTSTRFGTYNSTTGAFTNIANPSKPVGGAYAALAFDSAGVLFGLDLGPNSPPPTPTHLVRIDPATGTVTDIGGSIDFLDAIAFGAVPEPGTFGLLAGAGVMVLPFLRGRRSAR